jgi:hypothetical protein
MAGGIPGILGGLNLPLTTHVATCAARHEILGRAMAPAGTTPLWVDRPGLLAL